MQVRDRISARRGATVRTNDELCIQNEEVCIQNEEVCIQNDEFCSLHLDSLPKNAKTKRYAEEYAVQHSGEFFR